MNIAFLIGAILICVWVVYLFESRNEMNRRERLSPAFVFQWNILPLMTALELIVTGQLIVLMVGVILFFVAWPFARALITVLPFVVGWHVATAWFSGVSMHIGPGGFILPFISAIGLAAVCHCIYVAMMSPPRSAARP